MLSVAILAVLSSSSLIVSPDTNLPDKVLMNKSLPIEYTPDGPPSITPYAPLFNPNTYFPVWKVPDSGRLSSKILVKNSGSKYDKPNTAL